MEARLHLDAHPSLEASAHLGAQPRLKTAAEPGTEADSGLAAQAHAAAEAGADALAQAKADAVAHRGGQARTAVDAEIQRLVADHVSGDRRGRKEIRHNAFHRREAVLVGDGLRQTGDRVPADELESRNGRGRDGLNLLRADAGQSRVRSAALGSAT